MGLGEFVCRLRNTLNMWETNLVDLLFISSEV